VVDEKYQGMGIATHLYKLLVRLAKDRGIHALTADVLASNKGMMKVFEKGGTTVNAKLDYGVYHLTIPLETDQKAVT
jgi:RimJ/RimL family protein N-acetyltransferase